MKIFSKKTVKLAVLSLIVVALLWGCGCRQRPGEHNGKEAGLRIEYENGMVLSRRPHFTEVRGIVTMDFNGIDWYRVRVIQREEAESYLLDDEILAQSSNLNVFHSHENQKFYYACIFSPYDGSDSVFLLETNTFSLGYGFKDYIHYYADGEEVFPDEELDRDLFESIE